MKKVLIRCILLSAVIALTGCHSTTTICEFDADGKLIKKTETSESPIMTVEKSLTNKAVVAWGDGLLMSGSISPGTTDNPMPHVKGEFRNGNGGLATIPKDMPAATVTAILGIVGATKSDAVMGITADGVSIGGKRAAETASATEPETAADSTAVAEP